MLVHVLVGFAAPWEVPGGARLVCPGWAPLEVRGRLVQGREGVGKDGGKFLKGSILLERKGCDRGGWGRVLQGGD